MQRPRPQLRTRAELILTLVLLTSVSALIVVSYQPLATVSAQQPNSEQLPAGLQFVPPDAAAFFYADATKIWQHETAKAIRKTEQKVFDGLDVMARAQFGLTPDDVTSIAAFIPTLKGPQDTSRFGIAVGFKKPYDADRIQKGAEALLSKNDKVKVVRVTDRLVLVLVGLGDEYSKPQPAGKTGPLTAAIKDAAVGRHAAVAGLTLENLPDELRRDEIPVAVRAYRPLFSAVAIHGAIDLGRTIDLDVRVTADSGSHAIDCEKSLGALLALIQETLDMGIKEIGPDAAKNMGLRDALTLMKAGIAAAKAAKYSTQGKETRITTSLPADLPFATALAAVRQRVTGGSVRAQALNNLKQIGLAIHNYHDTYGSFPPAAVCDKKGNPQLSWRVLILPFIEQQALYNEFKLDEPWNSPNNKKLLSKMPKTYAIPEVTPEGGTDTHFRVFVGNGAGFDWLVGNKFENITDGTSNTLMCVTAAKAVPWTKPDELDFDPEKDMTKLIGPIVGGKVLAAFFDGSVRTFDKAPNQKTLNAIITRAGGEVIDELP